MTALDDSVQNLMDFIANLQGRIDEMERRVDELVTSETNKFGDVRLSEGIAAPAASTGETILYVNTSDELIAKLSNGQTILLGKVGREPIDKSGDLAVGGGLYAGNSSGDPGTGEVIGTGDIKAGGGISSGSTSTNPATGDVVATADGRFGGGVHAGSTAVDPAPGEVTSEGDIEAGGDLKAAGGISSGSVATNPATGDVVATADGRFGGGVHAGSTGNDPAAGEVTATGDIKAGGGISSGSTATNPATGDVVATNDGRYGGGIYAGGTGTDPGVGEIRAANNIGVGAGSTYNLDVVMAGGADRYLARIGISGLTNGVTVYYNNSSQVVNLWVDNDVSAATFTDRTPFPKSIADAVRALKSIQKKSDKDEVDHEKMDPLLKRESEYDDPDTGEKKKEVGRNLSMTVSVLVEVVKDLVARLEKLEKP